MDNKNIIIDNGTNSLRVGFSGDSIKQELPTNDEDKNVRPIDRGIIENFDCFEKLWEESYSKILKINPKEYKVLLTEPCDNPKVNREKMTQIHFEKFNVKGLFIGNKSVLPLFCSGTDTGTVCDFGEHLNWVVTVFEGYNLPYSIQYFNIGGRDLTDKLIQLLSQKGINVKRKDYHIIKDIKENFCYVGADRYLEEEKKTVQESLIELPDGQQITLTNEKFLCPEPLFNPKLVGKSHINYSEVCYHSITKADSDIRKDLFANIVLSGGSSLFPGITERIYKDLKCMSGNFPVDVKTFQDRKFGTWQGGSILTSLSSFSERWITKEEYDECGPSIVYRKCL